METPHRAASPLHRDLLEVIRQLSFSRQLDDVTGIIRSAARRLIAADGSTFILNDDGQCHYVDEDTISPLFKGQRFPLDQCVSGLAMLSRQPIAITDIYADERVPHALYCDTFVKSLAIVPVRADAPIAAIGVYWSDHHAATPEELGVLESLAEAAALAMMSVDAWSELKRARDAADAQSGELAHVNRELQQRIHEFEALIDVLPIGIGITRDREGKDIRVNRAFTDMLRLSPGANASMTAPRGERPAHFKVLQNGRELLGDELPMQVAAREGRRILNEELDLVFDDGDRIRLLEYATPLFDEQGNARGSVGAFVDVTGRFEADEQFRRLADSAPVLIWVSGLDKGYTWFNRGWFEFTGRSLERERGFGWAESLHDEDLNRVLQAYMQAFDRREPFEIQFRLKRHDGMYRWILNIGRPAFDNDSRFTGYIGSCIDVTEQRQASLVLQASERRFREMADHAPVMVWLTDTAGRCTFLSRSWYEFTGQPPEAAVGYGWFSALHPDDRTPTERSFRQALAREQPCRFEYRLRHQDGDYRWAINTAVAYRSEEGEFRGYIGSVMDITERKRLEEQRESLLRAEREARQEAERTNRIKDEFLTSLSHELRTPLNAILGWTQLLRRSSPTPEFLAQGLETLERNARLQTQLIADLLDMSRILSGNVRLELQQVAPVKVIEAAIDSIRPTADAKEVRLIATLDHSAGFVSADPTRLQQVVWNLLTNAVKFTEKGGTVEVSLERVDAHVQIKVTDSGIGIAPDFLPHVFERFRQADASAARRYTGLGIGLSIVKHLVELHGGTVRAMSDGNDRGATFIVALPLLVVRRDLDRRDSSDGAIIEPDSDLLNGVSVLVIDDDEDSRTLVSLMLTRYGATVTTVPSGPAALDRLATDIPSVIVSDIGLPDMDGYQLIRQIRALGGDFRRLPALALTAFARSDDRRRALQAGFQMHLSKPVEAAELCAAVASLATRYEA